MPAQRVPGKDGSIGAESGRTTPLRAGRTGSSGDESGSGDVADGGNRVEIFPFSKISGLYQMICVTLAYTTPGIRQRPQWRR